ncbi:hypothetical protein ACB098_09G025700 [Castanea mollissima]
MDKSTKFNNNKKNTHTHSNILGVFVAFFSFLFSNCLQYRKNRKLIGRNEKSRCNLNPKTQKFDTVCHFSKRIQKIYQSRQGTESGDPGYEDDNDDEEKGVVLSLLRSEIEGGREEDGFRNQNLFLEAFFRFLFAIAVRL